MKTIFITGVSSGLGRVTARLFVAKGWHVIGTMRNLDKETELSQLENMILFQLDVTDLVQIELTVKRILDIYDIDVVFNNAGYPLMGPFESYTDEQITNIVNTNFLGVLRVSKPFVKYFREQGKKGVIIAASSAAAVTAKPLASVYSATKWALEGWAESMSHDLAPFGIAVKTVSPGGMDTVSGAGSLVWVNHDAYRPLLTSVMRGFEDDRIITFSDPGLIASIIYEAATDGKDKVRYFGGADALSAQALRQELGPEVHRKLIQKLYRIPSVFDND